MEEATDLSDLTATTEATPEVTEAQATEAAATINTAPQASGRNGVSNMILFFLFNYLVTSINAPGNIVYLQHIAKLVHPIQTANLASEHASYSTYVSFCRRETMMVCILSICIFKFKHDSLLLLFPSFPARFAANRSHSPP